ncbi:unnamed protein product [Didymodactylos carnosus]|uniref:Uncharacterized protein n=1 Tax=Didymodactylos carnosus TaxID=1234261 RepID=A0A8S2L2D6_9BILA|nr:unnamed protein product [Didymodactylos carnosus]CAF3879108.1 unnamed protein product [Didymodactylos carnosus]
MQISNQHLTTTLNIIKSSGESFNKKIAKSLKNSQKERIHDDNDVDDDIFFDALNTCGDEGILIPIRKQEMTEASLRYSVQSLTDARSINIFSHAKKVDLQQSLIEAMSIMKLVFENRLNEGMMEGEQTLKYSKNNESKSIYHSLCHSGLRFMQAIMSFQMDDIETTNQAIKQTITLTKKIIEKSWFSESNASLEISTGYELHARLVYAEVLLLHSLLVFLQDQNLFSFIRGGMKMKECNDVFKKLTKYSQIDNTNEYNTKIFSSKQIYEHFDSGVRMGIGVFNIITSTLPERITKYLSLVGFSGKTDVGLIELKKSAISNGLRAPLSALFLLTYYLFIQQIYVNSKTASKPF